jgi:hypothetical protein
MPPPRALPAEKNPVRLNLILNANWNHRLKIAKCTRDAALGSLSLMKAHNEASPAGEAGSPPVENRANPARSQPNERQTISKRLVKFLLNPKAMILLDCFVLFCGLVGIAFSTWQFIDEFGKEPLVEDIETMLDVFSGLADIFVCYGVALESREVIMHSKEHFENLHRHMNDAFNHTSEISGILLVVLGLLLEAVAQAALIGHHFGRPGWFMFPTGTLGVIIVVIVLQQVAHHLWDVCKTVRANCSAPGP